MQPIANIAVEFVAVLHVGISVAEMFLWKRGFYKRLHFTEADAVTVAPIVANAGLYNAFIAAGLFWSACPATGSPALMLFFLSCVVIAGIFGAITLRTPNPLALQTLPGLVAAYLVWIGKP